MFLVGKKKQAKGFFDVKKQNKIKTPA